MMNIFVIGKLWKNPMLSSGHQSKFSPQKSCHLEIEIEFNVHSAETLVWLTSIQQNQ